MVCHKGTENTDSGVEYGRNWTHNVFLRHVARPVTGFRCHEVMPPKTIGVLDCEVDEPRLPEGCMERYQLVTAVHLDENDEPDEHRSDLYF